MEWVEPRLVRAWLEQNALSTDESSGGNVGAYNEGIYSPGIIISLAVTLLDFLLCILLSFLEKTMLFCRLGTGIHMHRSTHPH